MVRISSLPNTSHRIATYVVAGTLLFAGISANAADTAAPTGASTKTESCLAVNRIRHTKVIDDQTVLFYLPQNQIYKNVLPNKCSLLSSYSAIYYKPTGNQLCSVDAIGPLITDAPAMSTAHCGLGAFELIDKATADKLINDTKAKLKSGT